VEYQVGATMSINHWGAINTWSSPVEKVIVIVSTTETISSSTIGGITVSPITLSGEVTETVSSSTIGSITVSPVTLSGEVTEATSGVSKATIILPEAPESGLIIEDYTVIYAYDEGNL